MSNDVPSGPIEQVPPASSHRVGSMVAVMTAINCSIEVRVVVEIDANDRQAICRRVYPGRDDSLAIVLFANGGKAKIRSVKAWEMMPSNPY